MNHRPASLRPALRALVAAVLLTAGQQALAQPGVSEALLAVEGNRAGIVESVVERFGAQIEARGYSAAALREQLMGLRADQLLAASLVRDLAALDLRPVDTPDALQRYVAIEPVELRAAAPAAEALAYVARIDGALKVVTPAELAALRSGPARDDRLVGYFVAAVAALEADRLRLKDGSGTGANSWIGYTGGNNQATNTGAAVMAGLNNTASGPVSAVIAGSNNTASGQGALIGGGDNHQALGNYSVIVGGYQNRTTGADAVIVGGVFNDNGGVRSLLGAGARNRIAPEASYAFVGGGGRDTDVGTGAAGTNAKDNVAFSKWTFIGGGQGNRAGVSGQATANQLASVVGGHRNVASGRNSFVGGGGCNTASGSTSIVAGGGQFDEALACTDGNEAASTASAVVGGRTNRAAGSFSLVGAGRGNLAQGQLSVVVGGGRDTGAEAAGGNADDNKTYSKWTFVGGGVGNAAGLSGQTTANQLAAVVGGHRNVASGRNAFVGGGGCNVAAGANSTIGGGGQLDETTACATGNNTLATGGYSTIGGGSGNTADFGWSTIAGGFNNSVSAIYATVGGGNANVASAARTVIGGGTGNVADEAYAVVGGGTNNRGSGLYATVAGGSGNGADGSYASIAGGFSNAASGLYAAVLGGRDNLAAGDYSVVMGRRASDWGPDQPIGSYYDGSFVFADSLNLSFFSFGTNTFNVRATGGARIVTAVDVNGGATAGVRVNAGSGSWSSLSDANAKTDFGPVDARGVLARVLALPLSTWRYKAEQAAVRHMGPMAQDFRRLFGLGHDDTTITTVDMDGVALAAIQGLNAKLEAERAALLRDKRALAARAERVEADNRRLDRELQQLRAELRALAGRVAVR